MKQLLSLFTALFLFGLVVSGCQPEQTSDPRLIEPTLTDSEYPNDVGLVEKPVGPTGCKGKIGNFVWADRDCDGVQDCNNTGDPEQGLPGVTVLLKDPVTGDILATAITDSMGRYMFRNLCEGLYLVEVIPPDGYVLTITGSTDSTKDSGPNPYLVNLGVDQTNKTIDFGFCERVGGEGCTPGYWKQDQHFDSWPAPYTPDMLFSDVFEDAFPGMTMLDVLNTGGGGLEALGRHAIAALLNSASDGVSYDLTTQEVIDMFNDVYPGSEEDYEALKDVFEAFNEQDCPLD
jgi:hypothetical protein